MSKSIRAAAFFRPCLPPAAPLAQGMLLDFAADKVIKKFTTSSCDELKAMKGEPPSEKEKMAIDFLRNDSAGAQGLHRQDRRAVVMNKMFECGMIPRTTC